MPKAVPAATETDGDGVLPFQNGLLHKVFELQRRVGTFTKDKENPHFHYKYTSAQSVSELVGPILTELGLIARTDTEYVGVVGSCVIARATLSLIDVLTGESMQFSSLGGGSDSQDKGPMKANTAALKYATVLAVFGATGDDPEADGKTDLRGVPAPKPSNVVTMNRPAAATASVAAPAPVPVAEKGEGAQAQGAQQVGDAFVITEMVEKVWDGKATGRTNANGDPTSGPGTIVGTSGTKYDTFDKGLLGIARGAKKDGKRINIMFVFNEQFQRNKITEDGVSVFGEVPDAGAPEEGSDAPEY
jgi:hypothetical protein